jgi:GAF domain-containing protein
MTKNVPKEKAAKVYAEIDTLLKHSHPSKAIGRVCVLLRREFEQYSWVGIYLLQGETLHLVGWDGKEATEHTAIPLAKGICGQAARENRTVVVGDVDSNPEYLSCFPYTKSEIVVPITSGETVLGEIDIDGDRPNAYDDSDKRFLEGVASRLTELAEAVLEKSLWQGA